MDRAAHTPGLWLVIFDATDARVYANEAAARFVARQTEEATGDNVVPRAMPLSVALAAPDLLEALDGIRTLVQRPPLRSMEEQAERLLDAVWNAARAALAKADDGAAPHAGRAKAIAEGDEVPDALRGGYGLDRPEYVCAACGGDSVQGIQLVNPNAPADVTQHDTEGLTWRPGKCLEIATWCYDCGTDGEGNGLGIVLASKYEPGDAVATAVFGPGCPCGCGNAADDCESGSGKCEDCGAVVPTTELVPWDDGAICKACDAKSHPEKGGAS